MKKLAKVGRVEDAGKMIVNQGKFIGPPFDQFGLRARVAKNPNGLLEIELTEGKAGAFKQCRIQGVVEKLVTDDDRPARLLKLNAVGATISCPSTKRRVGISYSQGFFFLKK